MSSRVPAQLALSRINLIDPLNLWSLWVPLTLLALILLAAVYFIRTNIK